MTRRGPRLRRPAIAVSGDSRTAPAQATGIDRPPPRAAARPRRFHAYTVGLIKTGTTSFSRMFERRFRSRHEYLAAEVYPVIEAWVTGRANEAVVRTFLRERDRSGALEMDSAGFHFRWIALLVDEFPEARFVVTLRDCRSWLESLVNYVLDAGVAGGEFAGPERARLGLPFDLPYRDATTRERLRPALADCVPAFLAYWRDGNLALLDAVPEDRRLIVRTHEISNSLDRVAQFLGIDSDEIDATEAHSLRGARQVRLADVIEREWLDRAIACVQVPALARHLAGPPSPGAGPVTAAGRR